MNSNTTPTEQSSDEPVVTSICHTDPSPMTAVPPPRAVEPAGAPADELTPIAADYLTQADAAYSRGDLPGACEMLSHVLVHAPQFVPAWVCRGNVQFQLGAYEEALASYQAACELEPRNVDILVRLAAAGLRARNAEIFETYLTQALQLEPGNPHAMRLLADTNLETRRFGDAAQQYLVLLRHKPDDVELLLRLGKCQFELGALAAARQTFERVVTLVPGHQDARESLAVVARRMAESRPLVTEPMDAEAIGKLLQAPRGACTFMTDCVTKFNHTLFIYGWFNAPGDTLTRVSLWSKYLLSQIAGTNLQHRAVANTFGPNKGFRIQALLRTDEFDEEAAVIFETKHSAFAVLLRDLAASRISTLPSTSLQGELIAYLKGLPHPTMLDVGGRDRSNLDRSQYFPGVDVTVLDILPGGNVDVVGDAHSLSKYFPRNHFDAVYSVCVFEHLLMPWKVALEMNKVMKCGALGLIFTHQTLGLHDIPWDFWRFSDNAWHALFNKKTGFEILKTTMELEQFILPFVYRPGKCDAEKAAGFEGSCVLFRKIGESELSWDVENSEVVNTMYPSTKETVNPNDILWKPKG